ncbi:hypothetical protein JDV02_006458 [Purpureocillium takamizusanense]|uniref:Uncharacterized protein n=1 Tax=Purpureocillium takamizusanense TaxID=2060973 RepID=A0A9Q8QGB9_9HYPO|nr:uncharacterized protein JDV02_006458 [Purpureocillium takamizusanense]UNI20364.1 hypothetical protein JDV02_006458 [Purpureocillium takamizusanense]
MSNPRGGGGGATARLRRTFRYPHDSDSDAEPDAMDEQEQETLIANLVAENTSRNETFRLALLALPLLSTLPYLIALFLAPRRQSPPSSYPGRGDGGGSGSSTAFLCLLGLTSLLATAYLLHRLPPTVTGIAPLDAWSRGGGVASFSSSSARGHGHGWRSRAGVLDGGGSGSGSPLDMYLPYLNLVLVAMVALLGLVAGRGPGEFGVVGIGNLPALVYVVVLIAKVVMGSVDPERELSALKYRFKGA